MKPLCLLSWYSSGMNTKVSFCFSSTAGVLMPVLFSEIKYLRFSGNFEPDLIMLNSDSKNLAPASESLIFFKSGRAKTSPFKSEERIADMLKDDIALGKSNTAVAKRLLFIKSSLCIFQNSICRVPDRYIIPCKLKINIIFNHANN